MQVFNINELSVQLGKTERKWQRGSITGILASRPEGCVFISPIPGCGSSPALQLGVVLFEESLSGWNTALKRLLLVAGVQVEMEISQRIIFFFFLMEEV